MHLGPNIDHCSGRLRPRWRGRLHAGAAVAALPAGTALVTVSAARLASAVFALSMLSVYTTSAAYHLLARSPHHQQMMRRVDHAMIYTLIAGTYTPLGIVGLPPRWGTPMVVTAWLVAALGVAWCLLWKARRAARILYLLLGWAIVVAFPQLWATAGPAAGTLLVVGGIAYTVGAILFTLGRPHLSPEVFGYHELWHACTLIGGIAHFTAVALLVT